MKQYSIIAGQSLTLSHSYVTITNPDIAIYNAVGVIEKRLTIKLLSLA